MKARGKPLSVVPRLRRSAAARQPRRTGFCESWLRLLLLALVGGRSFFLGRILAGFLAQLVIRDHGPVVLFAFTREQIVEEFRIQRFRYASVSGTRAHEDQEAGQHHERRGGSGALAPAASSTP